MPLLGWAAGLGWTVLALVNVVWLLVVVWPMDAERTRSHATAEDPGRAAARAISLIGSVASHPAWSPGISSSQQGPDDLRSSSPPSRSRHFSSCAHPGRLWRFALRAPLLLQRDGRRGGIDFNQDEPPMYSDFGYFSVGLGMT